MKPTYYYINHAWQNYSKRKEHPSSLTSTGSLNFFFSFLLVNMKWMVQLIKTSLKNQCKNWMQSTSMEEQWIQREENSNTWMGAGASLHLELLPAQTMGPGWHAWGWVHQIWAPQTACVTLNVKPSMNLWPFCAYVLFLAGPLDSSHCYILPQAVLLSRILPALSIPIHPPWWFLNSSPEKIPGQHG